MIKRTLFRGIMERPLNGLIWAVLILFCSLFINSQKAQAETCSAMGYETTIAAGLYSTVGLKEDGTVVAVGYNSDQVNAASWTNIQSIAAGAVHFVGLKQDGRVVAAGGNNDYGQLNVNTPEWTAIKAVAAGGYNQFGFTVGLKQDGSLVTTGNNDYFQLDVHSWTSLKAIAAGGYHTVGLQEDGRVVTAGSDGFHQLDVNVPGSEWTNIIAIAAGRYHTVGLKADGTVVAVGSNSDGQLNVTNDPNWKNIIAIAAGAYHTVGLKADGTVVAVGRANSGQLKVTNDPNWTNIKAIAAGMYHTVGLRGDGAVVAVGYDGNGQMDTSGWSIKQPGCISASALIIDTTPPVLNVSVTPNMLWPPNHQMVTITPVISVKDNIDPSPKVKLLSVTSNEPDNGLGDGDTANDIVMNSDGTISLRAERSAKGSGRKYTITYQATDASGNAATATATVTVPHNK
jgi:hypothetical protein